MSTNRIVAIRVRSLRTTEGEERPTQVFFLNSDGTTEAHDLTDAQAELDFILGATPVAWRDVAAGEPVKIEGIKDHHLKWAEVKGKALDKARNEGRMVRELPPQKRGDEPVFQVLVAVPTTFIGIKPHDRVTMIFGGAAGLFARDLLEFWQGQDVEIWRISPRNLCDIRGANDGDKDNDTELLARLFSERPELFHQMRPIDVAVASLSILFEQRQEAMRQRIRVGNRLAGRTRNEVLRAHRSGHPIDTLETAVERVRASDKLYANLVAEETRVERELAQVLTEVAIWQILGTVTGVGVAIGTRIIAATADIRRFMVEPDPAEMARLQSELDRLLGEANYPVIKELMLAENSDVFAGKNGLERLGAAARWARTNSMDNEAALIQQAIGLLRQKGDLKRRADRKGEARFIAYCGLHVLAGGRMARRRSGENANWNPILRQAFWLLTEQFNRRPGTEWGDKLRANKVALRVTHPEPIMVDGKKRYSDGHILKMARWRTATQFARWFYHEWVKLERAQAK